VKYQDGEVSGVGEVSSSSMIVIEGEVSMGVEGRISGGEKYSHLVVKDSGYWDKVKNVHEKQHV
jgi:hypothetical protein